MKRDYMIYFCKKMGKTIEQMAFKCGCSQILLEMIEEDERVVTHPSIVNRIKHTYWLTDKQAEMMLPENYRPSSPKYDQDHYKIEPIFIEHPKPDREVGV